MPHRRGPRPTQQLVLTTDDLIRRRKLWPLMDAARLLGGVSRQTLYRWVEEGYLTFVRVDGRTFITDAELDRFVARSEALSK